MRRIAVVIEGVVQGVGFRPFVYLQALRRGLTGWVRNESDGVHLEVQGDPEAVKDFVTGMLHPPAAARVDRIVTRTIPPQADPDGAAPGGFVILESVVEPEARPGLPPDLALCARCAAEVDAPTERRRGYPFTNCTACGPRYSIIESLPYDRHRTSMKSFPLCEDCAREYGDPRDRRFHAQPIACPACGPRLELRDPRGALRAHGDAALRSAAEALGAGRIVALKGLGGYQLLCDATREPVVRRLRTRKQREEKPLAVMFPSLEALREACAPSPVEEHALLSPEAPIVLVRRRREGATPVAPSVAGALTRLGAMLPYTPLHRLLLAQLARPVVCTSGNLADEPMCVADDDAARRLDAVADLFLVHDRPILRPVDDSVAREGSAGMELLRRARGHAPLPLPLAGSECVLALGGQLKNTVALALDTQVVVSQHLGDLTSPEGRLLCARAAEDLVRFFGARPDRVACDLHPDYASTRLAEQFAARWDAALVRVQHHHAHAAACMAEHGLAGPALALVWDGAGLGTDGVLWGGEALVLEGTRFLRVAHLRPFALPGGARAMREPRRSAAGILFEVFGADFATTLGAPEPSDAILATVLARGLNAPRTTSAGRLFDAVAALTGVCTRAAYEGQAAMALEGAAEGVDGEEGYPFELGPGEPAVADWEPLVHALLEDRRRGVPAPLLAARFHEALAMLAEAVAVRVGLRQVVLGGGVFQNLRLSTRVRQRLQDRGFAVYAPRLFPPNDGGLSLGQAAVARAAV